MVLWVKLDGPKIIKLVVKKFENVKMDDLKLSMRKCHKFTLTPTSLTVYSRVRNHDRNRARFAQFSRQNFCRARFFSWVNNFWCIFLIYSISKDRLIGCPFFISGPYNFILSERTHSVFWTVHNEFFWTVYFQSLGSANFTLLYCPVSSFYRPYFVFW